MQLSAVLIARVIFFVESVDLNPRGEAFYPDVIRALVERYHFQSFPQKVEDFDELKGVTLTVGKFGNKTIEKVVIYNWGVTLETTSSTGDAEQLLDEALAWGAANLHLHYDREKIKRKGYVSHLTFYSDAPLLSLNPVLSSAGETISKAVSANLKLPYVFQPSGILIGIDPEEQRIPVQRFSIERREGVGFSENKYFSAAPISTEVHLDLLANFEKVVLAQAEKGMLAQAKR
jgi:hypothetical protein